VAAAGVTHYAGVPAVLASAAPVSDWFVAALEPAITALGISQAFAGLVIVAIAGNAIENVVGIQLAYRNQADFAMSVIIQSPLQIALVLAPALVLLSLLTATTLTLVFAPMLVVAVAVTVIAVAFIVFDGESTWLEGATLIALYAIIATAFWWG
jgi:Ca2+:H+ antiporter